jgi:hypothetical protein
MANPTIAAMQAELEALKAANLKMQEELAAKKAGTLTIKAGVSGTVCLYGIRAKGPAAYYPEEWEKIFTQVEAIRAFIKANPDKVSQGKDDKRFEAAKAAAKAAYEAKAK